MLHHLWIIGTSNAAETGGTVLLSRHFSQPDSTEEARDAELRRIVSLTRDTWPTLFAEQQAALAAPTSAAGSSGTGSSSGSSAPGADDPLPGSPGFLAVTYHDDDGATRERTAGVLVGSDVVVVATGDGVYDALALEQVLRAFVAVLRAVCCKDKEGLTEAAVLKEYRAVMLVVEDVFTRGIVHTTDPDVVAAALSMNLEKVKH